MLSSRRLELLLTLERQRLEHSERLYSGRRGELQNLLAQRTQLEQLFGEYQSAQAAFHGTVSQLRQQVRLSDRLHKGLEELAQIIEGAEQRLAIAEQALRHAQQRCEGWQQQLSAAVESERRIRRRRERRTMERRWLEGRPKQSKI